MDDDSQKQRSHGLAVFVAMLALGMLLFAVSQRSRLLSPTVVREVSLDEGKPNPMRHIPSQLSVLRSAGMLPAPVEPLRRWSGTIDAQLSRCLPPPTKCYFASPAELAEFIEQTQIDLKLSDVDFDKHLCILVAAPSSFVHARFEKHDSELKVGMRSTADFLVGQLTFDMALLPRDGLKTLNGKPIEINFRDGTRK